MKDITITLKIPPANVDLAAERDATCKQIWNALGVTPTALGPSPLQNYWHEKTKEDALQPVLSRYWRHTIELITQDRLTVNDIHQFLAAVGESHCTPWRISRRKIARYWRQQR